MIDVLIDDLKYKSEFGINCGKYQKGYRIVYFYPDNTYKVGTFSESIEDFMMDFVEIEPIVDDNDIPSYVSVDDILERYLIYVGDTIAVAIYKIDGTLIAEKFRTKNNTK